MQGKWLNTYTILLQRKGLYLKYEHVLRQKLLDPIIVWPFLLGLQILAAYL